MKKYKVLFEYVCEAKSKKSLSRLIKEVPLGSTYSSTGEYIKRYGKGRKVTAWNTRVKETK
jgi:hypothetical protein